MNNKLFFTPKHVPHAKLRLFLFPYAGGSISTYIPWSNHFNDEIELVIVQPPGRGSRLDEVPFDEMVLLVDEIMKSSAFICEKPFIFFGHSLGSRVAFETCVQLNARKLRLPCHLIASGSKAPHVESSRKNIHSLPEDQFIDALKRLNGTPTEVLDNHELISLLTPLLRADFKIAECYLAKAQKLLAPITVLGGEEDVDVTYDHLMSWKELTDKSFSLTMLPGNHFFINTHRNLVTREVNKVVLQELEKTYECCD